VRRFLRTSDADRLAAAWRLTLYGDAPRRGLRPPLGRRRPQGRGADVGNTRGLADYKVITKAPKSAKGKRTLPLDASMVAALEALQSRQGAELLKAGHAYESSGYVVTDEFHRIRERAGPRRIHLHDGGHTVNSLMAAAVVPDHIRAAWCGHTLAVNVATYTHARPEDMAPALDVLSKISKAV